MFNALSRVSACFLSKKRTVKIKRVGYTERRENKLSNTAVPNPWVTTCKAQMSAYIKATGIVFKTTRTVFLSFQCAEAH